MTESPNTVKARNDGYFFVFLGLALLGLMVLFAAKIVADGIVDGAWVQACYGASAAADGENPTLGYPECGDVRRVP